MDTIAVSTALSDSAAAGAAIAEQISAAFSRQPHVIIVFAAPTHDHGLVLKALRDAAPDSLIVGASSAGEFTKESAGEGLVTALALRDEESKFTAHTGHGLKADPAAAASEIAADFAGRSDHSFAYRSALILTDALAGYADALTDALTLETGGEYQFFGGGAGDNASFERTTVFCGTQVLSDAAVVLEILSHKPLGIGVSHGWEPASEPFRVSDAVGLRLVSLNGLPAVEAFEQYAEDTSQHIDRAAPIPFFLQNIIGIDTGRGFRLRVPLAVNPDGSVDCAAEVPVGSIVRIMKSSDASAVEAAERATDAAMAAIGSRQPKAALFFDCVATRLRCGEHFQAEVDAVASRIGSAAMAGCNTHGQIARAEGQFEGFHNCTAVVCVFPD